MAANTAVWPVLGLKTIVTAPSAAPTLLSDRPVHTISAVGLFTLDDVAFKVTYCEGLPPPAGAAVSFDATAFLTEIRHLKDRCGPCGRTRLLLSVRTSATARCRSQSSTAARSLGTAVGHRTPHAMHGQRQAHAANL